jgi:hypothetical protein
MGATTAKEASARVVDAARDLLDEDQKVRAAALTLARSILTTSTGMFSSELPDVSDMHTVAQWILTGEDPWTSYRTALPGEKALPLWNELFDVNGHGVLRESNIGINLRIKAEIISHDEPELAQWLLNVADAVGEAPSRIGPSDERLAELRGQLGVEEEPLGQNYPEAETKPCESCGQPVTTSAQHFDGKEWLCYPPADVSGVPFEDKS